MTNRKKYIKKKKPKFKLTKLLIINTVLTAIFLLLPTSQALALQTIDTTYYPQITHTFQEINIQHAQHTSLSSSTIRIGLESRYNNASVVTIANETILFGMNSPFGIDIRGHLSSGSGFRVMVDNAYYLNLGQYSISFDDAAILSTLYSNGLVHMNAEGWFGLYLGPFYTANEAINSQSIHGGTVIAPYTHRVRLTNGVTNILTADAPILMIDGQNNVITLGGRSYLGIMELGRQIGQGITPVNIIDVEDYLKSVVPSEMPASWHTEALKAQAVAARSFTYSRRGSHNHLGYELCDTIFSQVYSGIGVMHDNSTLAVVETRGVMAFHNNIPILATYFSSSGGFTENSENVWIEAVPYLVAVPDPFEQGAMEWERSFTISQINQFAQASNINIGHISSISIAERTAAAGGRVSSLVLHGSNGNHSLEREEVRTFFAPSADGSLHSRNFTMVDGISTVHNNTSSGTMMVAGNTMLVERLSIDSFAITNQGVMQLPSHVTMLNHAGISTSASTTTHTEIVQSTGYVVNFVGSGWGHGVGMSQFGANSMANQGFSFVQILQHYFTGVEVR